MNKDCYEHYSSVGVQKETDPFDLHSVKGGKFSGSSIEERKHPSLTSVHMHP